VLRPLKGLSRCRLSQLGPCLPHSLSPAGSHPTSGSHGALGSVGPSLVEVSALRYSSGQADPPDSVHMHIGGQMSTSLATGIVVAEVHAELEQSSQPPPTSTSRQPSATAAAARLPPEGPSKVSTKDPWNQVT